MQNERLNHSVSSIKCVIKKIYLNKKLTNLYFVHVFLINSIELFYFKICRN